MSQTLLSFLSNQYIRSESFRARVIFIPKFGVAGWWLKRRESGEEARQMKLPLEPPPAMLRPDTALPPPAPQPRKSQTHPQHPHTHRKSDRFNSMGSRSLLFSRRSLDSNPVAQIHFLTISTMPDSFRPPKDFHNRHLMKTLDSGREALPEKSQGSSRRLTYSTDS
jgi:hypothetical protein